MWCRHHGDVQRTDRPRRGSEHPADPQLARCVYVNVLPTKMVTGPPSGRMTFSPARPGFNPGLTVETAIERVRASDPLFSPPTNAVAYLGLYTEAVGDGTYRLRNQPAWGLTWKDACPPPP